VVIEAIGAFSFRHRRAVLVLAAAWFAIALVLMQKGRLSTGAIHGLEAEHADQLAARILGRSADTTWLMVFRSPDLDPGDSRFGEAMDRALAPLAGDPRVASVLTPATAPPFLAPRMMNQREHVALAYVSMTGDLASATRGFSALRDQVRSDRLSITSTGAPAFAHDLDRILEEDMLRAEAISLPVCAALLCAVFGSVVAALVPVLVGALAVASGIAITIILSRYVDLAQYTLNVCSLVGLGVAIDYSLFVVSRYREELSHGQEPEVAVGRALATAGRAVVFSGFAVTTGLAGLLFFPHSYLLGMGLAGAIVVGFAVLIAITFLPALLGVLGRRIDAGRLPIRLFGLSDGRVRRMAESVMRRPLAVLVPSLALLVLLGLPFLRLRMATSDVRVLPPEDEARAGYELLRADFPEEAANHITAVVEFPSAPALNPTRVAALYDFVVRVKALPAVTSVRSVVDPTQPIPKSAWPVLLSSPPPHLASVVAQVERMSVGERTVLVDLTTSANPETEAARKIVHDLRIDRQVGDGTVLVGGQTARDVDIMEYLLGRAPKAIAFVVVVTYAVLFLLLGSVALPFKAVVMNFLSISGSFGALVWIFQEGHAFVSVARPVEPALPILLFCILFGVSMDYEVLMLARMKEAYERTGDDRSSVAEGLGKCAGLITSAAAIMIAVFAAFALARVVLIQAVGFGMAFAIALDATVVRILVVPATMRLLGQANWWAPVQLTRIHRALGFGRAD
jgi:RND superfamily putative drug exporter